MKSIISSLKRVNVVMQTGAYIVETTDGLIKYYLLLQ